MYCLSIGFLVVWSAMLLMPVVCQENCQVPDGKPGLVGIPGRHGLPGEKGQKGDPAPLIDFKKGMKGNTGDKGISGEMGIKGYSGQVGEMGLPGLPGAKGLPGDSSGPLKQYQSAFSVQGSEAPGFERPVKFNKVLTDINNHFNLKTGHFICHVPGVYYFVFHAMSTKNLCLALKSDALNDEQLGFCDFCDTARNDNHVLSGGVVLKLSRNAKVWLEVVKEDNENIDLKGAFENILFNGLLIFQNE